MVGGDFHNFPRALRSFANDTRGAIGAFTVVVFGTMVVALGMAIDFMRHETLRTELQFAVDRGALAAATLGSTQDAEDVVRGYLLSTSFVPKDGHQMLDENVIIDVQKTGGTHNPRVEATATYEMRTFFLSMVGIPSIDVNVISVARQGVKDVEMAFVLDISDSVASDEDPSFVYRELPGEEEAEEGVPQQASLDFEGLDPDSLGWTTTAPKRIDVIREVAKAFIEDIYSDPLSNRLSIGLVPFAGSVNPGNYVFNRMVTDAPGHGYPWHSHSTCLEFEYDEFRSTQLPFTRKMEQVPQAHSTFWSDTGVRPNPNWGICPIDTNRIIYPTNDVEVLTTAIEGLEPNDGTATHIGVKWGAGLLDPSSRTLFGELIGRNEIPSDMVGRPYNFNSVESEKVLVIMTDGLTQEDDRPDPDFYGTDEQIERLATPGADNTMLGHWELESGELQRIGTEVRRRGSGLIPSPNSTRADFREICRRARDTGIRVFSLGFNLDDLSGVQADYARADLEDCASPVNPADPAGAQHAYATTNLSELIRALKTIRVEIAAIQRDLR